MSKIARFHTLICNTVETGFNLYTHSLMVRKLNRNHCVMFLFQFTLICERSWRLSSLSFRIMKQSSNRDKRGETWNHNHNI
jgi:hypothetical protein